jgi:hypothetical protein
LICACAKIPSVWWLRPHWDFGADAQVDSIFEGLFWNWQKPSDTKRRNSGQPLINDRVTQIWTRIITSRSSWGITLSLTCSSALISLSKLSKIDEAPIVGRSLGGNSASRLVLVWRLWNGGNSETDEWVSNWSNDRIYNWVAWTGCLLGN